ncbi:ABC transporter permease [Paenibacillus turpanensis]|uniref:ABC transporter permease n=1 Tax=Paenibacillus turpanensis TaxID=2689078 RepID=UPI00140E822A|nr:ABC transporter permease [Paenibacillus turpanensis]
MRLTIRNVIRDEWRTIFTDRRLLAMLLIIPLLYTLLFGFLYMNGRATEFPTVIADHDDSQLSRQMVQAFDESESFQVIRFTESEDALKKALASGEAKVGVVIPNGFSASLKHGDVLPVLTLIDGSNMMISNAATRGANEIVNTFSLGFSAKKLQMQGLRDEQISATFQAIPFRYRVLYNPTFNYRDFLVYGLVGAALQQVLLLGISIAVTRDKERGEWSRFAVWRRNPWRIAFAKSVPYFVIGMINSLTTLILGVYGFHLPLVGSSLLMLPLAAAFTFAVLGIGYLASLFSSSSLNATQTAMLVAVPSFMLSGFTFPFEAMPKAISILGHMLPLTYFLDGVRSVLVKGAGWESVAHNCISLSLIGLITFFISFVISRFVIFKKDSDVLSAENSASQGRSALPAGHTGSPLSM